MKRRSLFKIIGTALVAPFAAKAMGEAEPPKPTAPNPKQVCYRWQTFDKNGKLVRELHDLDGSITLHEGEAYASFVFSE